MGLIVIQNDLKDFLNDPRNMQRVGDLVEDIHYALMDYQVYVAHQTHSHHSDTCPRLHHNKTYFTRAVKKL